MLPLTDCSQGEKPSPYLAWFAYLVGILRGFVHLLADDLGGDLVEMGGEGTAQFLKLWPKRHLDEAGRSTDNDGSTVHPRVAEGLDDLSTRSEENTSELQSLISISYAVFCLQNKKKQNKHTSIIS